MNKVSAVKIAMLLSSAGVTLAPVLLALNRYGWNLTSLLTPSYTPPRVGFRMEVAGVEVRGEELRVTFKLVNLGEVPLELENLDAEACGPEGEPLAPVTLAGSVASAPGSTEYVTLRMSLEDGAGFKLLSYFRGRDRVTLEIRGEVKGRVLGSTVAAPLTLTFQLSSNDVVGLGERGAP